MAHILLIDDDELFRAMLAQMLSHERHRVTQAGDGVEGLRLAAQVRPDLIITDMLMPNKDGIETIMALDRGGSAIPVIAMSGGGHVLSAQFNLELAVLMGVKATLVKPFSYADLHRAIALALSEVLVHCHSK